MTEAAALDTVTMIQNKSSMDEKKIISRLILQKTLSADATRFMTKECYASLSKRLLSEKPDESFTVDYKLPGVNSYYATVASLNLSWVLGQNEIVDLDGNVWSTYTLQINPNIGNSYSNTMDQFVTRIECLSLVKDLVEEITSMVPNPIRVLTLDNAARIVRDTKRRYDEACNRFSDQLLSFRKQYRNGLRTGGTSRAIRRDDEMMKGISPGRYEFSINDGSARRPRYKKYVITVPEVSTYYASIKRIA